MPHRALLDLACVASSQWRCRRRPIVRQGNRVSHLLSDGRLKSAQRQAVGCACFVPFSGTRLDLVPFHARQQSLRPRLTPVVAVDERPGLRGLARVCRHPPGPPGRRAAQAERPEPDRRRGGGVRRPVPRRHVQGRGQGFPAAGDDRAGYARCSGSSSPSSVSTTSRLRRPRSGTAWSARPPAEGQGYPRPAGGRCGRRRTCRAGRG